MDGVTGSGGVGVRADRRAVDRRKGRAGPAPGAGARGGLGARALEGAALNTLALRPGRGVPLSEVEEHLVTMAADLAAYEARWLAWLAEFDEREAAHRQGLRSTAHWLNLRIGMSMRAGREKVRVARALRELPLVRAEFEAGRLSFSKVRAITRVANQDNETDLVTMAAASTASILERICSGYAKSLDQPHSCGERAARDHANRNARSERNHNGLDRVVLEIPAEVGEVAIAAIDRAVETIIDDATPVGGSRRITIDALGGLPAIRADAMVALLTGQMQADQRWQQRVVVSVDLDTYLDIGHQDVQEDSSAQDSSAQDSSAQDSSAQDSSAQDSSAQDSSDHRGDGGVASLDPPPVSQAAAAGSRCEINGRRIAAETARRLACDGLISALVIEAAGAMAGEAGPSQAIPRRVRRQLERRDHGHCQFPGCDASQRLHAHHVVHRAKGGSNELHNLILLCSHHHHVVHEGGWNVVTERGGDTTVFRFMNAEGQIVVAEAVSGDPYRPLRVGGRERWRPVGGSWAGDRPDYSLITATLHHNERIARERREQCVRHEEHSSPHERSRSDARHPLAQNTSRHPSQPASAAHGAHDVPGNGSAEPPKPRHPHPPPHRPGGP